MKNICEGDKISKNYVGFLKTFFLALGLKKKTSVGREGWTERERVGVEVVWENAMINDVHVHKKVKRRFVEDWLVSVLAPPQAD